MAQYTGGGVVASGKYTTTTALAVTGYGLTWDTAAKTVKLATAVTEVPAGISAATADNSGTGHMSYYLPGQTVKAVAGEAITKGLPVTVGTGGKFFGVDAKAAATTTAEYVWGYAATAAGADLDVFEVQFQPTEMDLTVT